VVPNATRCTMSSEIVLKSSLHVLLFSLVLSSLFSLRAIESVENSIVYAQTPTQSGYLYGSVVSLPGKIVKINLSTFTLQDTLILSVNQQAHALLLTNDSLFVGTLGSPATIIQIRLSDFKEINKRTLPTGFNSVIRFDTDGVYLYASLPGRVARLDFSSLSVVDWLSTYNGGKAESAQYYNGYLYVTSYVSTDSPAYLEKFDAATLSFVNIIQLSFKRAHFGLLIGNMYYIASNGVGGQADSTAGVMEINLDTFQEVRAKAFDTGDRKGGADKAIKYGEYLFLNGDVQPLGRVYKVRISDLSWSYIEATGPRLSAQDAMGSYGYFPSVNQLAQPPGPAQIFKINLDTFAQEDVLTFTGEPGIPQVVIQPMQSTGPVTITGKVTDIDTAIPVSGATVTANGYSTVSNQTGGYVIENLPLDSYTVSVNAVGYETKSTTVNASSPGVYIVDLQIRKISSISTITGIVKEETTERPISGALVKANGYATTTNSTGGYTLRVQPAIYVVNVSASGYEESSQTIDARAEGTYDVNFSLVLPRINEGIVLVIASVIVVSFAIGLFLWRRKNQKNASYKNS